MKQRMLEFLVEKMGFTVFAIEANWPESYAINDFVLNGKGDPAAALAGTDFWTWNTEEVRHVMAATGLPLFAIDLRSASAGLVREWLNAPHPMRIVDAVYDEISPGSFFTPVAPDSFDVIFFVNQTSPSRENPPLPPADRDRLQQGLVVAVGLNRHGYYDGHIRSIP